jgi:hypothetical protein
MPRASGGVEDRDTTYEFPALTPALMGEEDAEA